jgi:DNA-directed RNA polymerase I and III subunit RPAC1
MKVYLLIFKLHLSFFQTFSVKIIKWSEREMEFDLIGIHAAIANAFRRLLLSEVSCQ